MARIDKTHIERVYDYDLSLETRTLFLTGEIDQDSTERVIKGLHLLAAANSNPITIVLNSEGGDWVHGMAIYAYIRSLPNHVVIKAMGQAMSMATVILQAADERLAYPDTTIMVHHGSDSFAGNSIDYEKWADNSKQVRKRMCEIYAERSGRTVKYWDRRCRQDYILTPQEAVEQGLLDGVIK